MPILPFFLQHFPLFVPVRLFLPEMSSAVTFFPTVAFRFRQLSFQTAKNLPAVFTV
jgi:hypothetical protein